jgi:hypothetical protein
MVKLSQSYETEWTFQLVYVLPEKTAFVETPPDEVKALIAGQGWNLMNFSLLRAKQPLVFDLRALPVSLLDRRMIIDRIQGSLSESSLAVKNIELDYIAIRTGPKTSRRLPVRLNYEVLLQAQHDYKVPPRLTPDSVWVSGPAEIIDTLSYWPTKSGELGPLKGSVVEEIALTDPAQDLVSLEFEKVELHLEVEPFVEKTIYYVPVAISNGPGRIRIFPPSVTIYCTVGMSAYDQLDAADFEVKADLKGVVPQSTQNTVTLSLTKSPAHVKDVRFSPQSVEFFFQVSEEE